MPTDLSENPIVELVSDDTYDVLKQHDLLREKGVRNYSPNDRPTCTRPLATPSALGFRA